jgi:nucleoid-associated protein YgaU
MGNTRASLMEVGGAKRELKFRFNPKEYSTSKSATWNRPTNKSAKSAAAPEFGGVQPQTVTMELFFDDWENPDADLLKDIETLLDWLKPTHKSIRDKKPQPRILKFNWGSNHSLAEFHGFLKSVAVKYTMFKPDGAPVRATANISLEEVPVEPKKTNPTSGTIAGRRTYVSAAGDSLHSISYSEYGDPNLWRAIAEFNAINDPLRVVAGTRLLLPSADEAAALAKEA